MIMHSTAGSILRNLASFEFESAMLEKGYGQSTLFGPIDCTLELYDQPKLMYVDYR